MTTTSGNKLYRDAGSGRHRSGGRIARAGFRDARLRANPASWTRSISRDCAPPRSRLRPFRTSSCATSCPPMRCARSWPTCRRCSAAARSRSAALRLGPAARAMLAELQGAGFREAIATKFGLDLATAPTMIDPARPLERARRQHPLRLGRQARDDPALPQPADRGLGAAGGLPAAAARPRRHRELRGRGAAGRWHAARLPNGPGTWHGHKRFIGQRYVVQLNYMTNDERARTELLRHRVSAVVKRLLPAA